MLPPRWSQPPWRNIDDTMAIQTLLSGKTSWEGSSGAWRLHASAWPSSVCTTSGSVNGRPSTTSHGMENFPIEELELGVRSYNCLKRVGIETIGDLTSKSENELAAIPNFGRKSIEEVRETLAAHGLTLKGEELPL